MSKLSDFQKRIYAVQRGRNPGIYDTWQDCMEQVTGYSNGKYKSFPLREMEKAIAYVQQGAIEQSPVILDEPDPEKPTAYVRGSFAFLELYPRRRMPIYAYGLVIKFKGESTTLADCEMDLDIGFHRNIAGSIWGAMQAMEFAIQNNFGELDLYHDFEGIKHWCTGEWKPKCKLTILYKQFYNSRKDRLKVNFHLVDRNADFKYMREAYLLSRHALREGKKRMREDCSC